MTTKALYFWELITRLNCQLFTLKQGHKHFFLKSEVVVFYQDFCTRLQTSLRESIQIPRNNDKIYK